VKTMNEQKKHSQNGGNSDDVPEPNEGKPKE
jgi:hypothetical protein